MVKFYTAKEIAENDKARGAQHKLLEEISIYTRRYIPGFFKLAENGLPDYEHNFPCFEDDIPHLRRFFESIGYKVEFKNGSDIFTYSMEADFTHTITISYKHLMEE